MSANAGPSVRPSEVPAAHQPRFPQIDPGHLPPAPSQIHDPDDGSVYHIDPYVAPQVRNRLYLTDEHLIGRGLEGSVHLGKVNDSNRIVAIKKMSKALHGAVGNDEYANSLAAASVEGMKDYCIKPLAFIEDAHAVYLVFPLILGPNGLKLIEETLDADMTPEAKGERLKDIANLALDAWYAPGRCGHVHNDMHWKNLVFSDSDDRARLIDMTRFGPAEHKNAYINDRLEIALSLEQLRDMAAAKGVVVPGIDHVINHHKFGLGPDAPKIGDTIYPQHDQAIYDELLEHKTRGARPA